MTATTSDTTQTIEDLESKVEETTEEIETLESQLKDARAQIARAQARFAQLDEERKRLAPRTFQGDDKARVELEGLEDEHEELARATRVARAAEPELENMLRGAKERREAARVAILKARHKALREEMRALDPERDRLADALADILDRQERLYAQMGEIVRGYDQDAANAIALNRGWRGNWLRKRFSRLLG